MKKSQIEALEKASSRKMQDFDHLKKNTMLPTQTVLSSTAGLTKLTGIDIYNFNSNTGVGQTFRGDTLHEDPTITGNNSGSGGGPRATIDCHEDPILDEQELLRQFAREKPSIPTSEQAESAEGLAPPLNKKN